MKRRMLSADEYDAHTRWRRFLAWRPGERKGIKRRTNRRERREKRDAARAAEQTRETP